MEAPRYWLQRREPRGLHKPRASLPVTTIAPVPTASDCPSTFHPHLSLSPWPSLSHSLSLSLTLSPWQLPGYIREHPRIGTFAIAWVMTKVTSPEPSSPPVQPTHVFTSPPRPLCTLSFAPPMAASSRNLFGSGSRSLCCRRWRVFWAVPPRPRCRTTSSRHSTMAHTTRFRQHSEHSNPNQQRLRPLPRRTRPHPFPTPQNKTNKHSSQATPHLPSCAYSSCCTNSTVPS